MSKTEEHRFQKVLEIISIVYAPSKYWSRIKQANLSSKAITQSLILPELILFVLVGIAAIVLYGPYKGYSTSLSILFVFVAGVFGFVLIVLETVAARLVLGLFHAKVSNRSAYELLSFAMVPWIIAAIVNTLLNRIRILSVLITIILGLYSFILFYLGIKELNLIEVKPLKRILLSLFILALPLICILVIFGLIDLALLLLVDVVF